MIKRASNYALSFMLFYTFLFGFAFMNLSNLTVITRIDVVKIFAVHTEDLSKSSGKMQQSAYYCYLKRKVIVSIAFLRSSVMFVAFNRNGINLKNTICKKSTEKACLQLYFYTF